MEICCEYTSPLGRLVLVARAGHMVRLCLPGQEPGEGVRVGAEPVLEQTARWLDRYFRGERPDPEELLLKPEGTAFRELIWRLLLEIPCGKTVTYGELAKKAARILGKPQMSAQAVGQALRHNPIPIIVPCHRVLGSDGALTGYAGSLEGGLAIKRSLLELEAPEA